MEIHALSLADPALDAAGIVEMQQLFHSYAPVAWQETKKGSLAFGRELLCNRFSKLPYSVQKYRLAELRAVAEGLAKRIGIDLVFCDFLPPAVAMLDSPFGPRVILEHNVEFVLRKRMWATEKHPIKKRIFKAEWKKTWTVEKKVCSTFNHVLAVSEQDQETIQQEFKINHVSSIPTGVDTEFFKPQDVQPRPGQIVFVGSMDWYPNEDGLLWFLREVFPRIRAKYADARLTIVGKNPTNRFRQAVPGDGSVELTGRVDDVRPYIAQAGVVVVPLRVGGGTRIKIPEAMAMGRPIVSTTLGAEGLRLVPGREILLEDDAGRFAGAVLDLLGNPAQRQAIAQMARNKAVQEHGWDKVADIVQNILERVVENSEGGRNRESFMVPAVR
jgi:polysaccharide biosynthesis protein PslH